MKKYTTLLLLLLPITSYATQGIVLENKDIHFASTFRFRMQNRFTYETQDTENLSGKVSDLAIRRFRVRLDGTVWDPRLVFKIQTGLSNKDMGADKNVLLDAVAGWKFTPKTTLWVGQMKLPGNREYMTSSGDLNIVDRSIVSAEFNLDRDQGIQLHHEVFETNPLRIKLAVSNGEGRNNHNEDTGMSYTGRLEFLPLGHFKDSGDFVGGDFAFETSSKVSFGAAYNFMNKAHRSGGTNGGVITGDNHKLETMVFDYIYKFQGLSVSGEYMKRWASTNLAKYGEGFTSQVAKMLENNYEPVLRYSKLTGKTDLDQATIGFNKYINKHRIKIQNDLSYSEGPGRSYWTYRLQFDLGI